MFSVLGFKIDGDWFDLCSLGSGVVWMSKQNFARRAEARRALVTPAPFFDRQASTDFATGTSLFPFALLFFSPLSSELLGGLLRGGKLILSVASFIALTNILRNS